VPSIVRQGRTAAGTWHISSGGWDSRPDQTPVTKDDYTGGSIFSVSQLLQQQDRLQQQPQQAHRQRQGVGGQAAGRGGARAGVRSGPVPAGSLLRAGGVRKGPPRAGFRGPQAPPPPQLHLMQQPYQQQYQQQPYQQPMASCGLGYSGDDVMLQQLDYAEARVAALAAAAAAAAAYAGNGMLPDDCAAALAPTGADGVLGSPSAAAAAATGGLMTVSSTGTGQSLSLAQHHAPTGSQTTTGADPQSHQQQQQQQGLPQQPSAGQWCGFTMAGGASGSCGSSGLGAGGRQQKQQQQQQLGNGGTTQMPAAGDHH
jgi:hypothetical protein